MLSSYPSDGEGGWGLGVECYREPKNSTPPKVTPVSNAGWDIPQSRSHFRSTLTISHQEPSMYIADWMVVVN